MIKDKQTFLTFEYTADNYKVLLDDPHVSIIRFRVVNVGSNPNDTFFSKESIIKAQPTIYNKPLIGLYDPARDDFKGHAYTAIDIKNRFIVGTVPESCNPQFETYNNKEYFCIDLVLWKDYAPNFALDIIKRNDEQNLYTKISMEIIAYDVKQKDGTTYIDDYVYKAISLLGQHLQSGVELAGGNLIKFDENGLNEVDQRKYETMVFETNKNIQDFHWATNENFVNEDEIGKSEKIKINNKKDGAIKGSSWSNPGASLYDKLLRASNYRELLNEAYLIVEGDYKTAPSSNLKYPHHSLSGNELKLNTAGIEAASSRLNQTKSSGGVSGYDKALRHINYHRRELEMEPLQKYEMEVNHNMIDEAKATEIVEEKAENFDTVVTITIATDAETEPNDTEPETEGETEDACNNTMEAPVEECATINECDVTAEAQPVEECNNAVEECKTEMEAAPEAEEPEEECKDMEQTPTDTEMCGTVNYEAKCAEYEVKFAEYEAKFAEYEARCADYEAKCSEYEQKYADLEAQYQAEKIKCENMNNEQLMCHKLNEAQALFEKYSAMSDEDKNIITEKANDSTVNVIDFKALLYEYGCKYDKSKKYVYTTYPIINENVSENTRRLTLEEKVKEAMNIGKK